MLTLLGLLALVALMQGCSLEPGGEQEEISMEENMYKYVFQTLRYVLSIHFLKMTPSAVFKF